MPKINIPIYNGFYESDSLPLSAQSAINVYPQIPQTEGALSVGGLFRTPGIDSLVSVGNNPGRGFHKAQKTGSLYQVAGTQLIKQDDIANPAVVGTITGSGCVSMANNGLVVVIIVPGVTGYFYTISSGTLAVITDPIFVDFQTQQGGVTSVVEKDNRFIYTTDDEFFLGSDASVNDGKDFDALQFEDADVDPDPIIRAMEINNELYIFNSETTELYSNIGGLAFPYQRILGATIDKGLKSRFGIIEFNKAFMFLGNSIQEQPAIWKTTSGGAEKVSTSAIDQVIQGYSDAELTSVSAWSYSQDGSTFAGFTFPNETFVYDETASQLAGRPIWHKRQSNGSRWRVQDVVTNFSTVMVQDQFDGRVGELSRQFRHEYDANITRTFSTPYIFTDSESFRISSIELSTTSGVGTSILDPDGSGIDPSIGLSISNDGARTFKDIGTRLIGREGEYEKRQIWRRLGRSNYSIVLKFETSSPVLTDFQRLDIDLKGK